MSPTLREGESMSNDENEIRWYSIRFVRVGGDQFDTVGCKENLALVHADAVSKGAEVWHGEVYDRSGVGPYSMSIEWTTVSRVMEIAKPGARTKPTHGRINE